MESPGIIYDQKLFNRDVRRDVRNCVLFLFFFYAVNLIASGIVMLISMVNDPAFIQSVIGAAGGGLDDSGIQMNPEEIMGSLTNGPMLGLISIVGIAAGGSVFLIYRKKRFFTDLALPSAEPMTPKIFIILVVITQGIQIVYHYIVTAVDYLLPEGTSLADSYGQVMDGLFTPIGLLYVVLIGPIFEELIFRGAVMGALRRFGDNYAILFSSLLFGFYHMLILQIPFAFVLGLLLGYVAARWSLRASIALHIAVNGLSSLVSVSENETYQAVTMIIMITCAAASVIMAIKWRDKLKARVRSGAAYYANTYAYGFQSIAFWIFIVIMTLVGLIQMNLM